MASSDGEQMLELSAMYRTSSGAIAVAVSVLAHVHVPVTEVHNSGKLER